MGDFALRKKVEKKHKWLRGHKKNVAKKRELIFNFKIFKYE